MQAIKKYIGFIGLIFSFCSNGQTAKEELLNWSAERRLNWNDYKGGIDLSSDAAASTSTYLGIEYNFRNGNITYKITCSFSKNKSWGAVKTDYILGHEQGHFDITEIFARKLNKKTGEYQFNKSTYQKDLQKIYQDILDEKEEFQDRYDKETNYSRDKEKQAEWLKKIQKMLEELKNFENYN